MNLVGSPKKWYIAALIIEPHSIGWAMSLSCGRRWDSGFRQRVSIEWGNVERRAKTHHRYSSLNWFTRCIDLLRPSHSASAHAAAPSNVPPSMTQQLGPHQIWTPNHTQADWVKAGCNQGLDCHPVPYMVHCFRPGSILMLGLPVFISTNKRHLLASRERKPPDFVKTEKKKKGEGGEKQWGLDDVCWLTGLWPHNAVHGFLPSFPPAGLQCCLELTGCNISMRWVYNTLRTPALSKT